MGRIVLLLAVTGIIAGCATVRESRLNPLNWFGGSERSEVVVSAPGQVTDPRGLVTQIIALDVEKVPGGAIVRATGLPPRQGYFDAVLLPVSTQDGILNLEFRASPPLGQTRVGTPQSRELLVGHFVSDQTLAAVAQIRVSGATNALIVRR